MDFARFSGKYFISLYYMKIVGLELEEKLGALADTNIWLMERGESIRYQFEVPAAVQKYFMRGVDDQMHNILWKVRPWLREELVYTHGIHDVYTNVYWKR